MSLAFNKKWLNDQQLEENQEDRKLPKLSAASTFAAPARILAPLAVLGL